MQRNTGLFLLFALSGCGSTEDAGPAGPPAPSATMLEARAKHSVSRLPDGRVMVFGGQGASGALSSTEIFDPATKKSVAGPSMMRARVGLTTSDLPNGKILIRSEGAPAELYDPATSTYSDAGTPPAGGTSGRTSPMGDASYVFTGMAKEPWISYDGATNTWSTMPPLKTNRWQVGVARLPSGKLLIAGGGGIDTPTRFQSTVEIFDPMTKAWSDGPELPKPIEAGAAVVLKDGRVLLVGGLDLLTDCYLFDETAGTWTKAGSMNKGRSIPSALLLDSGKVLAYESFTSEAERPADIYDPSSNAWVGAGTYQARWRRGRREAIPAGVAFFGVSDASESEISNRIEIVSF